MALQAPSGPPTCPALPCPPCPACRDRLLAIPLPLQPALAKAAAARGQGVWEEARGRLAALLADRGFLAEDGAMRIPGNHCHFVTARKP